MSYSTCYCMNGTTIECRAISLTGANFKNISVSLVSLEREILSAVLFKDSFNFFALNSVLGDICTLEDSS